MLAWSASSRGIRPSTKPGAVHLVVANFAGDFPGLVGLLNLTGSMIKAGIDHSALWSKD